MSDMCKFMVMSLKRSSLNSTSFPLLLTVGEPVSTTGMDLLFAGTAGSNQVEVEFSTPVDCLPVYIFTEKELDVYLT